MQFGQFFDSVIATLESDILPALAEIEANVTPGITAPQLTATIEAKVQAYAAGKWGLEVGEALILLPSIKPKLDAVISLAVTKALPVLQSAPAERILSSATITPAHEVFVEPTTENAASQV